MIKERRTKPHRAKQRNRSKISETTKTKKKSETDESYSDRNKFKKVEMLVFTGEDPDSWLFCAERSQEEMDKFISWTNLKERMLVRFRSSKNGTINAQLLRIKQESSVEEYRNLFDKLVAPLSDLPQRVTEEFSRNDGGSSVGRKQRDFQKRSKFKRVFRREKLRSTFGGNKVATNNATGEIKGNTSFLTRTITLRSPGPNENRREGTYKRLPNAEFQIWKEKGLCFRCNEKYSADHKCKMKEHRELRMFVVANDKEELKIVDGEEVEKGELNKLEVKGDTTTFVELSINSVVGLNDPGTMKVRGKLWNEDVIIPIDCGATHNFVSEKLVKKLLIPIKETAHYGVILGSGAAVEGKGVCERLEIRMKNWTVKEDFLPLELGGVDIILGMQWLHSLGVTTVDWKSLLLTFSVEGKSIKIQGDPSLTKARVSFKNMIKAWGVEGEGFLVECRAVELVTLADNDCYMAHMEIEADSSLSTILKQFEDAFEWLEKLPLEGK
ncbi:ty3-gypsy retrotransposon protein [Cucumis melo var. makuwa]|uniref:Ty3-gypsy retrotransposon protein n=1 Tax=Cucumis melo var. makuwa TaxID=1194695 RepID=A0A5D3BKY1_CUCMM|nr:ty3-gypsy retrotransposon protein [Cucumis melo var. makuwa]